MKLPIKGRLRSRVSHETALFAALRAHAWLVTLVRLIGVVDALLHLLERGLQHLGEVAGHSVDALFELEDLLLVHRHHLLLRLLQLLDLLLELLLLLLLLLDRLLMHLNLLVVRLFHRFVDLSQIWSANSYGPQK